MFITIAEEYLWRLKPIKYIGTLPAKMLESLGSKQNNLFQIFNQKKFLLNKIIKGFLFFFLSMRYDIAKRFVINHSFFRDGCNCIELLYY